MRMSTHTGLLTLDHSSGSCYLGRMCSPQASPAHPQDKKAETQIPSWEYCSPRLGQRLSSAPPSRWLQLCALCVTDEYHQAQDKPNEEMLLADAKKQRPSQVGGSRVQVPPGQCRYPICSSSVATQVHTILSAVEYVVDAGRREHSNSTKQGAHLNGHTSR